MVNKNSPEMIGWYFIDKEGVQIKYPKKGVWPERYLEYAQSDYDEYELHQSPRNLINAVSNAKRALHYQVDALSYALGWEHTKGKRDFPSKLEFLGKCGVLSPVIIKRINRLRNTIEHDYYEPTDNEAQEYLEIVELYLAATKVAATCFPVNITVYLMDDDEQYDPRWELPKSIEINVPEGAGRITINSREGLIVDAFIKDDGYYPWVFAVMKQASY